MRTEADVRLAGLVWDFASLWQWPRTAAQDADFGIGLKAIAGLYASAVGSCVLRHLLMPPRPPELDGVVRIVPGKELFSIERAEGFGEAHVAALRELVGALGGAVDGVSIAEATQIGALCVCL